MDLTEIKDMVSHKFTKYKDDVEKAGDKAGDFIMDKVKKLKPDLAEHEVKQVKEEVDKHVENIKK